MQKKEQIQISKFGCTIHHLANQRRGKIFPFLTLIFPRSVRERRSVSLSEQKNLMNEKFRGFWLGSVWSRIMVI